MKKEKLLSVLSVILCLLIFAALGYLVYSLLQSPEDPGKLLLRGGIVIISLIATTVKVFAASTSTKTVSKHLLARYESAYVDLIHGAFSRKEQKKQRQQLIVAIHHWNNKNSAKAEELLKKLLPHCQKNADYAAVYTFLGRTYSSTADYLSAEKAFREVLRYDETRPYVYSALGMACQEQGKNGDAETFCKKALDLDPKNAAAYNNLGSLYFSRGDIHEAIDCGLKALELNGKLYQAATLLCLCYASLEDQAKSAKYLDIALANGQDAGAIRAALHRVKVGILAKQDMEPTPAEADSACNSLYRETAGAFARAEIPKNPTEKERSRLGGAPLGEVPIGKDGKPMRLLCAIDCAEVPKLPNFPEKGWLLFYITDDLYHGADFDNPTEQTGFRVLYTEETELPAGEEPAPSDLFPIMGQFPLAFTPDVCGMSCCDYRFEETLNVHLKEAGAPSYANQTSSTREEICRRFYPKGSHVLGSPLFLQADPRSREKYGEFDTLLLQIDSMSADGKTQTQIGDDGVMQFFIPAENLKKRDFSKILYWWDCY